MTVWMFQHPWVIALMILILVPASFERGSSRTGEWKKYEKPPKLPKAKAWEEKGPP